MPDIDALFQTINSWLAAVLFFDALPGEGSMPFIVVWLIVGAVFLTFRMKFANFRLMKHAFYILVGRYKSDEDKGEVTSFQALSTALSATIGLGNIAGVAIAISIGGPGAAFWMIVAGFLSMTSKFTEVTLGQMYRRIDSGGRIMGGPMEYLSRGFAEKGMPGTGKVMAVFFAVLTVIASLGVGNGFQVNQAMGAVQERISFFNDYPIVFGFIMAAAVGIVVVGGVRRIASAAEKIVPLMVVIYLLTCLWIIISRAPMLSEAVVMIVKEAFSPAAAAGGVAGVITQGFKRAAFSTEAGIGSAAIVHSAAKVKYPIRQGLVGLYEPLIDTFVCFITALVIILTGVYKALECADLVASNKGAALTAAAFGSTVSWFPIVLSVCVVLFAYSTVISWSYYGERCWTFVFGEASSIIYRVAFVAFVVVASISNSVSILDFSDLLLLAMAFPNFIALYMLSGKVKATLDDYIRKLKTNQLD